jgi:branched-chain amino acid transport system ATP-binding protein
VLEIRDLHVRYGKVTAVNRVSAAAAPGMVTLMLGANGAGKTTTLRAAAGLVPVHSGTVTLDGRDITGRAPHKIVRDGAVMVPEGRRMFASLTVAENLTLGGYTVPKQKAEQNRRSVLEMFPILAERGREPAGLLSGGEQQMLAFGRALMSSPRVMLLDEPSMGLAPTLVERVLGAVRTIADSGVAVLIVEQNADVGLEIADKVVAVTRGEVVFSGSAADARSNASVVHAFLGESALVQ